MKAIVIVTLLLNCLLNVKAQSTAPYNNGWVIGIGVNTTNDAGDGLSTITDFGNSYHFSNPFKLSLEKKFTFTHGVEIRGTTNKYRIGKKFNSGILTESINFLSLDLSYKYHFRKDEVSYKSNPLSGYGIAGGGRTWYNERADLNVHLGLGVSYIVYQNISLNFQAVSKLAVVGDLDNNYFQFDFGVLIPVSTIIRK